MPIFPLSLLFFSLYARHPLLVIATLIFTSSSSSTSSSPFHLHAYLPLILTFLFALCSSSSSCHRHSHLSLILIFNLLFIISPSCLSSFHPYNSHSPLPLLLMLIILLSLPPQFPFHPQFSLHRTLLFTSSSSSPHYNLHPPFHLIRIPFLHFASSAFLPHHPLYVISTFNFIFRFFISSEPYPPSPHPHHLIITRFTSSLPLSSFSHYPYPYLPFHPIISTIFLHSPINLIPTSSSSSPSQLQHPPPPLHNITTLFLPSPHPHPPFHLILPSIFTSSSCPSFFILLLLLQQFLTHFISTFFLSDPHFTSSPSSFSIHLRLHLHLFSFFIILLLSAL